MELRKKLLSVAALAFAAALSTGIAVSAGAEDTLDGFAITGVSVRTEGTAELPNATGIRFKTVVGENAATTYADADCYTNISFTSDVEGSEKAYSKDVAVQLWRSKGDGWNTVVVGIPESDYATEITAKSYIKVSDTLVYETGSVEMSIEEAAAKAMQNGDAAEKLEEYTKNAVSSIELDKATATVQAGEVLQLTATTDAQYGVAWFSSDTTVATVDKNGKVWGVSEGEATITAKMGNVEATCVVTVTARDLYDFETEGQLSFASNILGCGSTGTNTTTWEIAEVGAAGNHALQKTDNAYWSRGMQVRMSSSYLAKVFETYDFITFDFYTNVNESAKYEVGNLVKGENGKLSEGTRVTLGTLTGVAEGDVFKYNVVLKKADFESVDYTDDNCALKFTFASTTPSAWYIDNFEFAKNKVYTTYDFESADQLAVSENLIGIGATGCVSTWAIAENVGSTGNSALQKTDASWSRGMQWRLDTAWLDSVFANNDYISFDVYTDQATMQYVRLDKTGGLDTMLYGNSSSGSVAGQAVEGGLYKYNFAFSKNQYTLADGNSTAEIIVLRFMLSANPTAWYFDNLNVAGKYDENTIDFANGQQTGAILGFANGGNGHAQVVERAAGNYALQLKGASSSGDIYFGLDLGYLQYVFGELNATSIEFSIYCTAETTITTGAFRTGNGDASDSRNTTGVTAAIDANDSSKVNVTITKDAYAQWSNLTSYMKVFARCSAAANGAFVYVDDFQINK